MWTKIIRILTSAILDDITKNTVLARLSELKLFKKEIVSEFKSLYKWMDPSLILKYLKKENPLQLKKLLEDIEKRSRSQGKDLFKENYADSKEWVNLQSSWIKYGKYEMTNKVVNTGNMTLIFQPKAVMYGPYTYPSVPADVWLALKNAPSNAGTLFWRIWLRVWLPSMIREEVKKGLRKKGIYAGKKGYLMPEDVADLKKHIRTLEQRFYREIGRNKRRSIKQIGTYKWKQQQKEQRKKIYQEMVYNRTKLQKVQNFIKPKIKVIKKVNNKLTPNIKYIKRVGVK